MSFCKIFNFIILLNFVFYVKSDTFNEDFYSLLGVNRMSSLKEIKEAYKNEARKWHPEINPSEDASYRFYLVNEAYKTLSDPEKKSLYEVFGKGNSEIDLALQDDSGLEGNGFYLVTSQFAQSTSSDLWTISSKYFDKIVKPESHKYPFLLFVTSVKCEHCKEAMADWINWCHKLAFEGTKCGHIVMEEERWLLRRLHAPSISGSAMVGILEGRPTWNVNVSTNLQELRHFLMTLYPGDFLPELDSNNYMDLLRVCSDQRNHVLFTLFTNSLLPPLAYYNSIFYARSHISGAFVHLRNPSSKLLLDEFNVSSERQTLLVFKEDRSPSFKLSLKSFKKEHFDQIIRKHSLLKTPRISCPVIFDLICPPDTPKAKKMLCVILLTGVREKLQGHLESFKKFSEEYLYGDRVKFAYVLEEKQRGFVQLVTWGGEVYNSTSDSLKVMIAWRKDSKMLNYEFLEEGWPGQGLNLQRQRRRLVQLLDWLLNGPSTLSNVVELKKEIVNEHLKSLWIRILVRLREWCDGSIDFFLGIDNSTYMMVAQTLLFVLVVGFGFRYLALREVRMLSGSQSRPEISPAPQKNLPEKPVIYIHMLSPENYKHLLVESPSSVRLLLLLVDSTSKDRLIKYFGAFLQPYARSRAFKFAFVNLQEYFQWYEEILDLTMRQSEHYQLLKRSFGSINVKNCLGTVLAINGEKRYYFMYHISSFKAFPASFQKEMISDDDDEESDGDDAAKEEFSIGLSQRYGLSRRRNGGGGGGGSPTDGSGDRKLPADVERLFEFDLLKGLGIWLEKLCQGKLKKFRISQWPKSMTSKTD